MNTLRSNAGKQPPEPVTAAGGVLFRLVDNKPHILLIHRKGLWDLPKGKLENNESIAQCAAREVSEETGSEQPFIVKRLCNTLHRYYEHGKLIEKTTHWYIMLTRSNSFTPQASENINAIQWMPLDEAIKMVAYDNLKVVLGNFKDWVCQ